MPLYIGNTHIKQLAVSGGTASSASLQTKTVTLSPTATITITPDSGYDGLASATINLSKTGSLSAGSSVTVNDSTAALPITIPANFYQGGTAGTFNATVPSVAGGTITPTTSQQIISTYNGKVVRGNITVAAAPASGGIDTSDANAAASDILSGKTAYVKGNKITGSLTTKTVPTPTITVDSGGKISVASGLTNGYYYVPKSPSATTKQLDTLNQHTYYPTTTTQTINAGQYLIGQQVIAGDSDLLPENIRIGVSIFGVEGEFDGGSGTAPLVISATAPSSVTSTSATRNLTISGAIPLQLSAAKQIWLTRIGTSSSTAYMGEILYDLEEKKGILTRGGMNSNSSVAGFSIYPSQNKISWKISGTSSVLTTNITQSQFTGLLFFDKVFPTESWTEIPELSSSTSDDNPTE